MEPDTYELKLLKIIKRIFVYYVGRLKSNAHMLVERERNDLQNKLTVSPYETAVSS
jgi:hypothetical protein